MNINKVDDFIQMINKYKITEKEPNHIKIIFGLSDFHYPIQKYSGPIEIYKKFGSVAFLLNNRCDYISSETRVWNILLGENTENTKLFLNKIKAVTPNSIETRINISNLISCLYFEKGVLLLNRNVEDMTLFKIFQNKNVTDVLFLGVTGKSKSLAKYFPNAKMGIIKHPSNLARATSIYEKRDSKEIETISLRNKNYPKTTFEAFKVLDLN